MKASTSEEDQGGRRLWRNLL
uniref:Uncharacterized protein n=1 Tax=Rhizophora mucronata TaxID=61149 RepID=A0A2P2JEJ9_RHIMU